MTDPIATCRANQQECASYMEANGWDWGAALGFADWLVEERLIEKERAMATEAMNLEFMAGLGPIRAKMRNAGFPDDWSIMRCVEALIEARDEHDAGEGEGNGNRNTNANG